uniref:Inter-alpha-trypsin inhibitor heavy chain family, member 4 n=1 Tax=Nothobranchius korthausae TaxID=1143690 RepID=A0A1A8G465_9TELE
MQPVADFKVDVYIYEKAGISYIDVKGGLSTKALANAITKTHADKQAWVHFYPTVDQQKTCDSCGEQVPTPPVKHRFLLKEENNSPPLCFDITGSVILKLLHHPSRKLYVNGELKSETNAGFTKIVIHIGDDQHVEIQPEAVTVREGQSTTRHTGQEVITAGSVTIFKRDKEVDVTAGDVRLVILIHEKNGNKFLWPVLRQKPSASNAEGLLVLKPTNYQEVLHQGILQIKGNQMIAIRSAADDYSVSPPVELTCWLISFENALQKPLQELFSEQI